MDPRTTKRLLDAIGACEELDRICLGTSRAWFLEDRVLQLAVWKLIEIVGEALHQAELRYPELESRVPELRDVVNTRNRVTHGYDSVNMNILWDIATHDMPVLREQLLTLLPEKTDT